MSELEVLLLYAAFFIYGVGTGISSTSLGLVYPELTGMVTFSSQIVTLLLLFLKVLLQNYRVSRLSFFLVVIALVLIVSRTTDDFSFVWLAVFVMSSEGARFKDLAKVALVFNVIIVISAGVLSGAGAIPNLEFVRDGVVRSAVGFLQPNNYGSRMLQICLALYVIRYQRYNVWDYVFILACAALTWALSNSRTSVYMMLALVVVGMPLASHCAHVKRPRRWIMACMIVFAGAFAFSMYFMVNYDSANWAHRLLNNALSDRLYLMRYYYEAYPPSMLGQYLGEALTNRITYSMTGLVLDNAYARLVEVHGFALAGVFVALCLSVYLCAYREGKLASVVIVFTVFAVIGVAEASMLSIVSNYSLIALGVLLFGGSLSGFAGEDRDCPSASAQENVGFRLGSKIGKVGNFARSSW